MPVKTMDAFRDHGVVEPTLTRDVDDARRILAETERLGLKLDEVTDRLVSEGVAAFAKSFDTLIATIAQKHPATA
jgi:transaldolase/glucose-6-phosphate isomerase